MKTIAGKNSESAHVSTGATPAAPRGITRAPNGTSAATTDKPPRPGTPATVDLAPHPEPPAAPTDGSPHVAHAASTVTESEPPITTRPAHPYRKALLAVGAVAALAAGVYFLIPWINAAMNTISTDDAYVNGHVTYVAPRVSGQVMKVLVDDNQRVKKGDLLVQLDKEPFEVVVALKRAAVRVAETNLDAAESKARGLGAQLGAQRWKLQNASEQVDAQTALLRAKVAALRSAEATLARAQADYKRAEALLARAVVARESFDQREQEYRSAAASVAEAQEAVAQVRVALGLAPVPEKGKGLGDVPPDLNQTFSAVRAALGECMLTATQLGLPLVSTHQTPNEALEGFRKLDQKGDIDQVLQDLVPEVPFVLEAKAGLEQTRHDLEQAELNLRYCDIVSEIDGVVVGRNVNPGNAVRAGQALMAVRSLTEIWIDANFKETQLADLRIGQRVVCEVDMYGSHKEFEGRISGFTMGTGQTLSLLPAQNATGNFVKIVQRLPVRIELIDYDPEKAPLFVGLSVEPFVYYKEPPTGPHAGEILQPLAALPTTTTAPRS